MPEKPAHTTDQGDTHPAQERTGASPPAHTAKGKPTAAKKAARPDLKGHNEGGGSAHRVSS